MCKLFVAVALLAVAVYANHTGGPGGPGGPHSPEAMAAELKEAGVSETAITGIQGVYEQYKTQMEAAKGNHDSMKTVMDQVMSAVDTYIKTQSEADQTAFAKFLADKKAEMAAHHSTPATH